MTEEQIKKLKTAIENLEKALGELDPTNVFHDQYFTVWTIRLLKYQKLLKDQEN